MKTTGFTSFLSILLIWEPPHANEGLISILLLNPGLFNGTGKVSISGGSGYVRYWLYLNEGQWTRFCRLSTAGYPGSMYTLVQCRVGWYPGMGYGDMVRCLVPPRGMGPGHSWPGPNTRIWEKQRETKKIMNFAYFPEKSRKVDNFHEFRVFSRKVDNFHEFRVFSRKVNTGPKSSQYWPEE